MEDAREARRKKLAERRTDRLSFITGQNRSLAQSDPQVVLHPAVAPGEDTTVSEIPKHYPSEDIISNVLDSSHMQEPDSSPDRSRLHKHELENEYPQGTINCILRERKTEAVFNENNRSKRGEDISGRLFTTSMLQKPAGHDGPRATNAAPNKFFTIFTPREISHSVVATANIRLLITFVVAFLVVSSYKGFLVGDGVLSSIINFRPLFLLLLGNVTIILGWVFLNQGVNKRHEKDLRKGMNEDEEWPNDLRRILKIAQVLQKVLGAAFMDCSICAVIMICGIGV